MCFLLPRCCTDSPTPPCSFSSRTPAQTAGIRSSDGLVSFMLRMRSRAGDGRGPWTHSGLRPVLRQQVHGPGAWEWGAGLFCTRVPPQCLGCGQHPRALHGGDRGSLSTLQISIPFPGFLSQPQECLHGVRASGVPFPSFKPLSPLGLSAWNLCSDLAGSVPGCSSVCVGGAGELYQFVFALRCVSVAEKRGPETLELRGVLLPTRWRLRSHRGPRVPVTFASSVSDVWYPLTVRVCPVISSSLVSGKGDIG